MLAHRHALAPIVRSAVALGALVCLLGSSSAHAKQHQIPVEQVCPWFDAQVVKKDKAFHLMQPLIRQLQGKSGLNGFRSMQRVERMWIDRIQKYDALFEKMDKVCGHEQLMKVLETCKPTHGKPRLQGTYAEKDPIVWCMAAEKGPDLVKAQIFEHMAKNDAQRAKSLKQQVTKVSQREGWFPDSGLKGWKDLLFLSDEQKATENEAYANVLEAAGVEAVPDTVFTERNAVMAALRAEVERLAPTWELPSKGKKHYGVGLAKKQAKGGIQGAKVLAAHAAAVDWSIDKNALGVPTFRNHSGWVLLQAPDEPMCQLRRFTVSETYKGGGKFQKASSVAWADVRFQPCK